MNPDTTKRELAIGWASLVIGVAAMFVSLWWFVLYGLLYLGTFVLAVKAMRRQRVLGGSVLLLTLMIVPPTLWVLLTVYRGATALDHGITRVQHGVAHAIDTTRRQDEETMEKEAAEAAVRHRANPALGVWAVTMWDDQGAVLQNSDPVGGFEQRDEQAFRFSIPVDQRRWRWRMFTITGGGSRGEWRDEPASGWSGWFEIDAAKGAKNASAISFTWNEAQGSGAPRRGVFTQAPTKAAPQGLEP